VRAAFQFARQIVRDVVSDHLGTCEVTSPRLRFIPRLLLGRSCWVGVGPLLIAVFDLWEKRQQMGETMKSALDDKLQARHAYVTGLQVLSLSIPQDIQDAIETTSVAFQNIGKARFEKDAETVRAKTRRLVVRWWNTHCVACVCALCTVPPLLKYLPSQAEKTSEVTVLQAEATAATTLLEVAARATARNVTVQAEADAFAHIKQYVGACCCSRRQTRGCDTRVVWLVQIL